MIKDSDTYFVSKGTQDRHFPALDKLSYDNYLVAVNKLPDSNEY